MKKTQIWDPYKDFQKTVLPNGLSIYSAKWNRPWMHMRFCVHSGSLEDPRGKEGLAHLVEHMISERSGNLSNKNISHYIKMTGSSANLGNTSPYRTSFSFETPITGKSMLNGIDIFGKILSQPLEEKSLGNEKKIVLQEFKKDFPTKISYDVQTKTYANAYCGTRFDGFMLTIGNPKSIQSIRMIDIERFFTKHYVPTNMSIIAAGGMSHKNFVEIIENSIFSQSSSGYSDKKPELLAEIRYPYVNEEKLSLSELYPNINMDIGSFAAYAMIPGTVSKELVSLLRNELRAILYEQIREKSGSTYSPNVSWQFLGDSYEFSVVLFLEKEKLKKVTSSDMPRFLSILKNKKRFDTQKQYLVKSFIIDDLNMETFCERAEEKLLFEGYIESSESRMENFENLAYDKYCSLIDYLSDERRWWRFFQIP